MIKFRLPHSVYTSQPLFPSTSVISQQVCQQSGRSDKNGGYIWAQHMDSFSLRLTRLQPLVNPQSAAAKANTEATRWHHTAERSASYMIAS